MTRLLPILIITALAATASAQEPAAVNPTPGGDRMTHAGEGGEVVSHPAPGRGQEAGHPLPLRFDFILGVDSTSLSGDNQPSLLFALTARWPDLRLHVDTFGSSASQMGLSGWIAWHPTFTDSAWYAEVRAGGATWTAGSASSGAQGHIGGRLGIEAGDRSVTGDVWLDASMTIARGYEPSAAAIGGYSLVFHPHQLEWFSFGGSGFWGVTGSGGIISAWDFWVGFGGDAGESSDVRWAVVKLGVLLPVAGDAPLFWGKGLVSGTLEDAAFFFCLEIRA